jgi:hypothetical protein
MSVRYEKNDTQNKELRRYGNVMKIRYLRVHYAPSACLCLPLLHPICLVVQEVFTIIFLPSHGKGIIPNKRRSLHHFILS